MFGVGLLYGWVFERSRSIIGISIGHGQANVVLFFIAPNLPAIASWLSRMLAESVSALTRCFTWVTEGRG